jgi:hypothetical protein
LSTANRANDSLGPYGIDILSLVPLHEYQYAPYSAASSIRLVELSFFHKSGNPEWQLSAPASMGRVHRK